jgi:hypothetical protein
MPKSREEAMELAAEAFRQWAAEGTVSAHYLESVLGSEEPFSAKATVVQPPPSDRSKEPR